MSFTNVYYKRATGTPKACYICFRPTTCCLATTNAVDFLYACESHLTDRGFASEILNEKKGPSEEEIAAVKKEFEEKQRKKAEAQKAKQKEADEKAAADKDNPKTVEAPSPTPSPVVPAAAATASPGPTHQKYALHRDYFAMRQGEHRKRRQAAQAKTLAPRLPVVPGGGI